MENKNNKVNWNVYLRPNWDDAQAEAVSMKTVEYAENFGKKYFKFVPSYGPCPDGSVDLYVNGELRLLINFPENLNNITYSFQKGKVSYKGSFSSEDVIDDTLRKIIVSMNVNQLLESNGRNIIASLAGSHTYGLATEDSDYDYKVIHIADPDFYFGITGNDKGTHTKDDNIDIIECELLKFVSLCAKCNPNFLEILFVEDHMRETSKMGNLLIQHRYLFLTQNFYDPFIGYAIAQRKRIDGSTTGYLGQKRKDLIHKYGYDIKYASHAIRLLDNLLKFMDTGNYQIANLSPIVKDIKFGKVDYKTFEDIYYDYFTSCNSRWEKVKNNLPKTPDYKKINELTKEIILSSI